MEKDLCNRDTDLSKFIAAVRGKNCLLRLRTIAFFLGGGITSWYIGHFLNYEQNVSVMAGSGLMASEKSILEVNFQLVFLSR